jgi:protein-S-isoprenylcysteine O-methyltransferase Ste14
VGRLLGLRRARPRPIEDAPPDASFLRTGLAYGFFLLAGLAVVAWAPLELAFAYATAWRLTSVLYLSVALTRERRRDREGAGARFARFGRIAAFNINNDAVALVVLCLATRGTLPVDAPLALAVGAALVALGLAVKAWAARSLGYRNYYCRDFFLPPDRTEPCRTGPYRFLRNPMYTVGYAHAYGFALLTASWPGLLGALFAQASMLLFWALVERPHVNRTYRVRAGLPASPTPDGPRP